NELSRASQHKPAPAPSSQSAQATGAALSWQDQAKLLLTKDPELSDRRIAAAVGKSASTLSRDKEYQAFAEKIRSMGVRELPKGDVKKARSGDRSIEAVDDTGDPAQMDWD